MKIEEVLDIMEQGTSLSEEQIQKLKNDPDLMKACEDIHIAAHLLRQQKEDFDVEARLEQFNNKHSHSLRQHRRHAVVRKLLFASGVAAAAAVLWAVFFLHSSSNNTACR